MKKNILLRDENFLDLPIGEFPWDFDHSATGEYHYIDDNSLGVWYDPVSNYTWAGNGPSWIITENYGRHFIEQMRIEKDNPHRMYPTLETGSVLWHDGDVRVKLQRLSVKGMAGLYFHAISSLNGLVFFLENRDRAVLAHRYKEEIIELASCAYPHDSDTEYELRADSDGDLVRCFINGEFLFEAHTDIALRGGKCGITADCPTRFTDFTYAVDEDTFEAIVKAEADAKAAEQAEMAKHSKMKLWKKIDLKNFGTSRQLRFGHLMGGDTWYAILAQMQRRVRQDDYGFISCLTAIDLDGNILWQWGEPSEKAAEHGKISADMPMQIYDIDGDGIDEVIVGRDFHIEILDGRTGKPKKSVRTPYAGEDDHDMIGASYGIYAFDRLNPDGIRIANFSGKDRPTDLLIKDRYGRVWAMDSDLNVLWKFKSDKNTGHCPLPVDINGDGRDEVLVGYNMLSADGKLLWSYPIQDDHTDEIVAGKFRGTWDEKNGFTRDENGYFACVSGTQGFFIGDMHGNIVARDHIGHAQRVSVAPYLPGRRDFQIAVTNFWGHRCILYLYDCDGKQLLELENELNGLTIAPVNWDGTGEELILMNAESPRGGMITGEGIRAVAFPDDGHPTLATEVLNLTGDDRDEIICWDYNEMWIYTQEDEAEDHGYHPVKFPEWNASNYRGEYAFPDESYLKFKK